MSLTCIEGTAFYGCGLTEISIPENIKELKAGSFESCVKLETVSLHSNIEIIGIKAFKNCQALQNITLPDNVKELKNYAFQNCNALNKIIIPSQVTSIGLNCFVNCKELKEVECKASTPPSLTGSFNKTPKDKTLYVPVGKAAAYEAWKKYGFSQILEK